MNLQNVSAAILVGLMFTLAGCGEPATTVRGSITYDGQPVPNGAISFLPKEGQGSSFGAVIRNGEYRAEKAVPGKALVRVVGVDYSDTPLSLEEVAARSKAGNIQQGEYQSADFVPFNAVGNMQEVEIKPGAQKLDFELMPPK